MAQSTRLAYPVRLDRQDDGSVLVSFPDVPEALTEGATEREALGEAEDCLVAALGGYVQDRRDIPRPSPARGRPVVALPALVAAKIALYRTMRARGVGNTALAEQLGTVEGRSGVCLTWTTVPISAKSNRPSGCSGNDW